MSSTTDSAQENEDLETAPAAPAEPFDWQPWFWGGLLALLVVLVYWPTLGNGYIWDDDSYVLSNLALRSPEGLYNMWFKWGAIPQYYPLVHSTLWLEYQLWGFDPHGYHLVNMLLHATGVILLWRVLLRLNVPGAWLAAAIFAVHPVCVESVAWVSELKNVQSCALALASILMYLRYAPPDEPADAKRPQEGWDYELALGLFVAALLSKTVTAVVPAVLLVIYWWKRGRITWAEVAELLPMFVFGATLASITVWLETSFVGASGAEWNYSFIERVLIAGRALWFYAGKLVWPHPLTFFYPRFAIDAHVWWQYLFPLGALLVLGALWLARRAVGRGPLAAALIFVIGVAPALGFFNVFPFRYSLVADHFQYQAAIALVTLAAAGLTLIGRSLPRVVAAGAGGLLLLPLAVVAHEKTHVYENLETLYTDVIAGNPESWVAHINLADYLDHHGRVEECIPHYRLGLEYLTKENWHLGDLGRGFELTGQMDAAIAQFEEDLEQEHTDAEKVELHRHLGDVLVIANRDDEAIKQYESALAIDDKNAVTLSSLGHLLVAHEDAEAGLEMLRKSIELNPNNAIAQQRLGIALRKLGNLEEALTALAQSTQISPNVAKTREELAMVLLAKGDVQSAAVQLQQSLVLDPKCATAHNLAGMILAQSGKFDLAVQEFQESVKLDPKSPAKANLEKLREFQAKQQAPAAATDAEAASNDKAPSDKVPADVAPAENAPADSPATDDVPAGDAPENKAPGDDATKTESAAAAAAEDSPSAAPVAAPGAASDEAPTPKK